MPTLGEAWDSARLAEQVTISVPGGGEACCVVCGAVEVTHRGWVLHTKGAWRDNRYVRASPAAAYVVRSAWCGEQRCQQDRAETDCVLLDGV